jgi:mono/diheme cytochrome c family protein
MGRGFTCLSHDRRRARPGLARTHRYRRTGKSRSGEGQQPGGRHAGVRQIFTRNCAPCHGITAEGGPGNDLIPAAPDLTDDKWDHGSTDGEVFDVIKNGVAPEFNMIPWKDKLKDPDIWNVVNYLRSIAKKK